MESDIWLDVDTALLIHVISQGYQASWKRNFDIHLARFCFLFDRPTLMSCNLRDIDPLIRDDHVTWDKPDDMEEYIAEDIQRQVDMGEQLVRVAISTAPDQTRVWALTLHHSLCDGWTVRQLLEQTAAAYRGQTLHERPFSSFMEYVLDKGNEEAQQYWQTEFANLDPRGASFPPLPSTHYAPQAVESLTYPVLNLTDKGTKHTLTTAIRLAMAIVLSRYSGSSDVVVGLTTSGRSASLPGINTITGPTLGTYPMQIQLDSSETVEDVMSGIQASSIRVLPFEHFGLQNIRNVSPDAARAYGYSGHAAFGGFAFAMSCMLEPRNDGFTVLANYDPQTITHDPLTTFFSEFEQVVRQICGDASAEFERSGDISQAPVNETANIVREAVADVLDVSVDSLKMSDNFFRIGGDSIAAMLVSAKCRSRGLLLTVTDIFQKKTIAKIAEKAILAQSKGGVLQNEGKIDTSAAWDALVSGKLPALGVVNVEDIEEIVPCTPLQQVMWLTGSRKNGYYQPHTVWELMAQDKSRPVDTDRLREAWKAFIERHSTYRSLLVTVQQLAYQVVLKKPFSDNISTVRCTAADLQDAIARQKDTPWSNPHVPYRLTIFQTDGDKVFLLMEQHHALDDAVSSSIFVDEWSQLYGGNTPDGTPVPFSKYIASIHSSSTISNKAFWTQYLKDISPCLLSSHDGPIHRGNLHSTSIQLDHMRYITQFFAAHDITIAIFFKSLWAALLHRLTSLTDIFFGYLVSTRNTPDVEATGSTGFYLNMLIQRLNIDNTTKMTKVLDVIQQDYGPALTHQFQALEALNAPRPSRVFSTLVNHRRHAIDTKETRSLRFEPVEWSDGMDFDIVFEIDGFEDDLQATLTYWDGRVEEEMVSKSSKIFTGLLSAVMENPEQVVRDVL
ncbi:condensation domain-containing protein [Aspergillus caelatus]|uniref:Condensation domain-containing protein n=1 Tax=Aspergillus caelatus TaxID=61420 RepID=A0A5N7A280_9EURO|nr:condensation domain-containing protein [Aspergillus caelatus]KAE8363558.1 condensation domain-containing protein [Aspergillus caelatus]